MKEERPYDKQFDQWYQLDAPKGWKSLVYQCIDDILEYCPDLKLFQVKEKFGGLRIYVESFNTEDDYDRRRANTRIIHAEWEANFTCQECGHMGRDVKERGHSWIIRLCDDCENKRDKA